MSQPHPSFPSTDLDVDVLVVGAGISGIAAGHYFRTMLPEKTFAILESRTSIGGTWDLFRYPGVRSDSDLQTFGFAFKPWARESAIADASEIMSYLHEAVAEDDLARDIRFGHRVLRADWSSDTATWTVQVQRQSADDVVELTCRWLISGAGYYDYEEAHAPSFEGQEDFAGPVVHPQFWPEDLDYANKSVVVIGSGATAVTVVPAMADSGAGHVTMLQRSPSYVLPLPGKDPFNGLRKVLGEERAYRVARRGNLARQRFIYKASRRHPAAVRRFIRWVNKRSLPEGYDVDLHFRPQYEPWDERLCAVRDGDLFRAISEGTVSVVTDRIRRFTPTGIELESGARLDADIIVTATGLKLLPIGGITLTVDGEDVVLKETLAYKAMMLSDVPNFVYCFGYTNSSWTLKIDLVFEHLCRLIAFMDDRGQAAVVPVADDPSVVRRPFLDFHAGYVRRAVDLFPTQGSHGPWTLEMNYAADKVRLQQGPVDDPALRYFGSLDRSPALSG